MATYASRTDVPASRSRDEIEATLTRYGADQFMYGWDGDRAVVQFRMPGTDGAPEAARLVRFVLTMPAKTERRFTHHLRGRRTAAAAEKEWEQATRQRWRALALVVKAKLEAVESGIAEFESEFLAYIVLPGGETVGEHARPGIAEAYRTGAPQLLLPA